MDNQNICPKKDIAAPREIRLGDDVMIPTYPAYVISGVNDAIKEADNGELTPYTGIREMLDIG